jgi:Bacterial SH3 domain
VKWYRKLALLLIVLCFSSVAAQGTDICATFVQQALNTVEDACAPTGRNQACYGNVSLEATPRPDVPNFTFQKQGDLVNVADVDTLQLKQLDAADNIWGIALMKIQANLPDRLPGQNVTFLLFGDVKLQNAVPASPTLNTVEVTSNGGINVRTGPGTNYQVAGSLAKGQTATADGRNSDGLWLRIQIPDSSALGWVFTSLVTPASDVSALSVVDASQQEVPLKPMQAFYFSTGITGTGCTQAPQDGILIQTPEGAGTIDLRANDVDIHLGSTAYLQAQPSSNMTVSVVEGESQITANGKTVTIPAGAQVTIPVDANLKASGEPTDPQPYDAALVAPLPVQVLPLAITIAPPITAAQIQAANAQSTAPQLSGSLPGNLPGLGNLSGLSGMDLALFCSTMKQAFASAGMTPQQYLEMLSQYKPLMPADSQAGLAQFEQMLKSCP